MTHSAGNVDLELLAWGGHVLPDPTLGTTSLRLTLSWSKRQLIFQSIDSANTSNSQVLFILGYLDSYEGRSEIGQVEVSHVSGCCFEITSA